MHTYLIDLLQCPICAGNLHWHIDEGSADQVDSAETQCQNCGSDYSVREGIGLFLTPDLPRNDLWQQVDSGLLQHLLDHPQIEQQLMDVPLNELSAADQFMQTMVMEAHGKFAEAKMIEAVAMKNMYSADYQACWKAQVDALMDRLAQGDGPIVDLASGRGYLLSRLVHESDRPLVATDFSPYVLRRNRDLWRALGLQDKVSLLCFDARKTPFKDGAVQTLTSNLGLANIEEPGHLLSELKRIVNGTFYSIAHFFDPADEANKAVIQQAGLEATLYQESALALFASAGWQIDEISHCSGLAHPTPASAILEGVRIDGLPVAETTLNWCLWAAQ